MVRRDQFILKFIFEQREIGAEYYKWVMKLMGFDFTITYNPGRTNIVADTLSRREGDLTATLELCTALSSMSIDWDIWMREVKMDSTLSKIFQAVKAGTDIPLSFTIHQDKLFYKGRFVLVKASGFPICFDPTQGLS